jgi:protein O-mannosyl-transferase
LLGIGGGLTLDDRPNLTPVLEFASGQRPLESAIFDNHSGSLGRVIAMASFVGNAMLSGTDIRWFKATNVFLHLLCALAVYGLAKSLIRFLNLDSDDQRTNAVATWIAALWAFHPVQVSTVLYVVQRMTQLSALFVVLCLLLHIKARVADSVQTKVVCWTLATIAFAFGIFSKENAALAIPLLILIEFARARSLRQSTPMWLSLSIGTLIAGPALALVIAPERIIDYSARDFTVGERLLSQARAMVLYLQYLIAPDIRLMSLFQDDFRISRGLLNPPETFFAAFGILALITYATLRLVRRPLSGVAFGLMFFFVGHLMESTVIQLEMVFDHRNYLPSIGIVFAMVYVIARLGRFPSLAKIQTLLLTVLLIIYASLTLVRVISWANIETFLLTSAAAKPESLRAHNELALHYASTGDKLRAAHYIERSKALSKSGPLTKSFWTLAVTCMQKGQLTEVDFSAVRQAANTPVDVKRDVDNAFIQFARAVREGSCGDRAAELLANSWIFLSPHFSTVGISAQSVRINQTYLLLSLGRNAEALTVAREAARAFPERLDGAILHAQVMLAAGSRADAERMLQDLRPTIPWNRPDLEQFVDRLLDAELPSTYQRQN